MQVVSGMAVLSGLCPAVFAFAHRVFENFCVEEDQHVALEAAVLGMVGREEDLPCAIVLVQEPDHFLAFENRLCLVHLVPFQKFRYNSSIEILIKLFDTGK